MSCSSDQYLGECGEEALDRSLQKSLSLTFAFSAIWLLVASLLGALAFWQIKFPGFIDYQRGMDCSYCGWFFQYLHQALNYGRAIAASKSLLTYGWLLQGFLGVAFWISARLANKPICKIGTIFNFAGIALWNVGILVGLIGICAGEGSGYTGFDLPAYSVWILFIAYAFFGLGLGMRFAVKTCGKCKPSEWYLIGAAFWFPWFFAVVSYFVHGHAVLGVISSVAHAWYMGGLHVLVLSGLAIAALYFFVPMILGVPLNRCHTAKGAFWLFAFLGGWSGMRELVGGPFPAWMITTGVVAGGLLLIPAIMISNNQMVPLWSNWCKVKETPVLWFLATGGISFVVWVALEAFLSLRTVSAALRFSYFQMGVNSVLEYAFLSMVLFGAIYAILPKITGKDLSCCVKCCTKKQFWFAFCGVITFFIGTFLAGAFMGLGVDFAPMAFLAVTNLASPFFWISTLGGIMMLFANVIFVKNVLFTLVTACCESNKEGCCS